jgi:tRNA/tmRNA/rRNA uracil-C5-methylase (TrmA/RlmC/RlmD family)
VKLSLELGQLIEVDIGPIAHGGHCVARHNGQVIFVRHTLPNERVIVEVTSLAKNFARGDAVRIIDPSPDRVSSHCRYAGVCGGCDFQHVSIAAQRKLKAAVITEQFHRLAKMELVVVVEEIANEFDQEGLGLHWRSRVAFVADDEGSLGLRRNHSHNLVLIESCPIAIPSHASTQVLARRWPPHATVQVIVSNTGDEVIMVKSEAGGEEILGVPRVDQTVLGRTFKVAAGGFWQVHPAAPQVLSEAVIDSLSPVSGDHVLDLYAGAGLFTGALLSRIGATGRIELVESSTSGVADAKVNFGHSANVTIHHDEVLRVLHGRQKGDTVDLAVLDPPRAGAGAKVLGALCALRPRRVAYVACDPAALARDTAYLRDLGYFLIDIRAFDLFPMTHHVECVATFGPVLDAG